MRRPFQTRPEIERQIARGGLSPVDVRLLWESLFLTRKETEELLKHVRDSQAQPFLYPMVCLAAHTGARRLKFGAERVAELTGYHRNCPAVLDLYDATNPGPHDELLPIDILAVNALNAFGARAAPMTPMTEAWIHRAAIGNRAAAITQLDLELLSDADREAQLVPLRDALIGIDEIRGFGSTATTKLLHRLRPNVVPIWDSRVARWYPEPEHYFWINWLQRVYSDVLDPNNRASLEAARAELPVRVPLLRAWDILLWQIGGQVFAEE